MTDRAEMIRHAVALSQQAAPLIDASEALFAAGTDSRIPYLDTAEFDAMISSGAWFSVAFTARWCDACAELLDHLEAAMDPPGKLADYPPYRFNVADDETMLERFGEPDAPESKTGRYSMALPLTVVFAEGEEVSRIYGPDLYDWHPPARSGVS